ncbi:MAG: enoyl-CoA hydratase-related protein [Actinomycetota bacterium]|uniref:Enoyl-CoA hydratase-related protein n=1 Tax=Mycobacterium lentiflavum TaxID=141349 RepID=A0ABY3V441_MYCLN|nr:enoyl-CoA hydratase-related protein [Mycobacterium lentiflavum]MEE3062339.1 enoyl-CoA hydratase-related protein [Actinomycetota bacterium]ULP44684.1 enoyl-CoA hydratase-related protein [Mycobacterium lentiflavum]
MTVTVERDGSIAILTLGDDENRFSPEWLDTVNSRLTDIENNAEALVTVGTGKFYSNGLDLDWLSANSTRADWYVDAVQGLLARLLTFPRPTVAAVNGHAFGAGAMLGIAHDYRVMRSDRGYYCFPEVDIKIPFTTGMAALVQAKLSPQSAVTAMTTGRRFPGPDAQAAGLVDDTAPDEELVSAAVNRLQPLLGKDRGTLGAIKSTMYASVTAALRGN